MYLFPALGILGLILLSAFFSASEIAYTSVNRVRLRRMAQEGNKRAGLAQRIMEQYDAMLYTILIGNNLVNIGATSLAAVIAISLLGDAGAGVSSIIMTLLILLFGEILPKAFGRESAERMVQFAAYPLRAVMWLFRPIVRGVQWLVRQLGRLRHQEGETLPSVTEEEFAVLLETAEDEGVLDEERSELLQSALAFDDITVQEILTPRPDIYAIDIESDPETVMEMVLNAHYSRIPVYEESLDSIIGVLYVTTYLKYRAMHGAADVRSLMQEPQCIYKTMKLDDALTLLRQRHVHVAVVLDEFGGTLGIVTMEDILEELVGDIWDESDEAIELFTRVSEDTYECEGSMPIRDFFDLADVDDQAVDSEYVTLGGWATEMLHETPKVGESFTWQRLHITVLAMDGIRVTRLRVQVEPEQT